MPDAIAVCDWLSVSLILICLDPVSLPNSDIISSEEHPESRGTNSAIVRQPYFQRDDMTDLALLLINWHLISL
ncbi:MAG: hypothetical protein JKY47_23105 [Thalassospira sp.]|jgi:hypothetical protein|nr:hypothetical protein [Thalassospira sp.]